jgi:hypothetical protein
MRKLIISAIVSSLLGTAAATGAESPCKGIAEDACKSNAVYGSWRDRLEGWHQQGQAERPRALQKATWRRGEAKRCVASATRASG